jgi:voltage-gated potassium channel
MLCLCVWALLSLALTSFARIPDSVAAVLEIADYGVCFVFFLDFLRSVYRAPKRFEYLIRWGWIDLLSSIPVVDSLRWGRAARVMRILRVMRGVRSARAIAHFIAAKRAESAFLASILLTLLVLVCASITVLQFEPMAGGTIRTAQDAMWWAVSTMTTTGYGDAIPITAEGRIASVFLMAAGVGLFGTVSAVVASWFLSPGEKARDAELEEIHALLLELRKTDNR